MQTTLTEKQKKALMAQIKRTYPALYANMQRIAARVGSGNLTEKQGMEEMVKLIHDWQVMCKQGKRST